MHGGADGVAVRTNVGHWKAPLKQDSNGKGTNIVWFSSTPKGWSPLFRLPAGIATAHSYLCTSCSDHGSSAAWGIPGNGGGTVAVAVLT